VKVVGENRTNGTCFDRTLPGPTVGRSPVVVFGPDRRFFFGVHSAGRKTATSAGWPVAVVKKNRGL